MFCHWQNLNEDRRGKVKGTILRAGRAWIHVKNRWSLGWEWAFGRPRCFAAFEVDPDGDHTFQIRAGIPGASLYIHLSCPSGKRLNDLCRRADQKYGNPRAVGFRIHDWALWWDIWADQHEWRHDDPKWRQGSFHPGRLLGKRIWERVLVEAADVLIPMPEKTYVGTAKIERVRSRRRWWPFAPWTYAGDVQIPGGIPVPGKGEDSWDCGMDATYGLGCQATTIEEAVAAVVRRCLETRQRHGVSAEAPGVRSGVTWRPRG
jgi:hypothetical protein